MPKVFLILALLVAVAMPTFLGADAGVDDHQLPPLICVDSNQLLECGVPPWLEEPLCWIDPGRDVARVYGPDHGHDGMAELGAGIRHGPD